MVTAQETGTNATKYPFGIDPAKIATQLRTLADAIDAHGALPQLFVTAQIGNREDFVLQRMILTWAEKKA